MVKLIGRTIRIRTCYEVLGGLLSPCSNAVNVIIWSRILSIKPSVCLWIEFFTKDNQYSSFFFRIIVRIVHMYKCNVMRSIIYRWFRNTFRWSDQVACDKTYLSVNCCKSVFGVFQGLCPAKQWPERTAYFSACVRAMSETLSSFWTNIFLLLSVHG